MESFGFFLLLGNELSFKPSMDLVGDHKALNWLPGWMLVNAPLQTSRGHPEGHGVEALSNRTATEQNDV